MKDPLTDLATRYRNKTGHDWPLDFESLTIVQIRRAVERVERGETVFLPKSYSKAPEPERVESSLMDWDWKGEF